MREHTVKIQIADAPEVQKALGLHVRVVEALENLVWAWDQREGVEIAHQEARAVLAKVRGEPQPRLRPPNKPESKEAPLRRRRTNRP